MSKREKDISVIFYKALVEDILQLIVKIPQAQPYSRKMLSNQNHHEEILIMLTGKSNTVRLD